MYPFPVTEIEEQTARARGQEYTSPLPSPPPPSQVFKSDDGDSGKTGQNVLPPPKKKKKKKKKKNMSHTPICVFGPQRFGFYFFIWTALNRLGIRRGILYLIGAKAV